MTHASLQSARRAQAGFTLTELMVAITGGLLLAIAVFALARDSTRFYRQESRVGDATMAAVVGFQRLQADLQRAAFMASPNIQTDTNLCPRPLQSGYPARITEMGAIRILDSTVTLPSVFSDSKNATTGPDGNGALAPEVLLLAGAFNTVDRFLIQGVDSTSVSGVFRVWLQGTIGPLARLGFVASGAGGASSELTNPEKDVVVKDLFPADRAARIVDVEGRHYYGEIVASGYDVAGTRAFVDLDATLPLAMKGGASADCGLTDTSIGYINVVNFVVYEIQPGAAVTGAGGAGPTVNSELDVFEQTRTDLVRYELDVNNNVIANTREIVAEYAVDLRFSVGVAATPGADPTALTMFDETNRTGRATFTGNRALTKGGSLADVGRPEDIVLVRARLSVRSQMPDRQGGIPAGSGIGAGFYRMWLGNRSAPGGGTREHWARVRTLQADITLRNSGRQQ